ncbi:MAG: signal peptidase II [Eubacteriales bacterium]|nr:signal peptidase II [Eubacteriales bacterium]
MSMAFWIMMLGAFVVDRVAKLLSLIYLSFGASVPVWAGVLELRLTRNTGMALGLLSGQTLIIIALPVLTVLGGWLVLRRYRGTRYTLLAMGLVVGGFLGNVLDRVILGFVLDMIYFPWMPWYVCNLADIAICVGVVMLAISLLWRPQDWQRKMEATTHEANGADRGV